MTEHKFSCENCNHELNTIPVVESENKVCPMCGRNAFSGIPLNEEENKTTEKTKKELLQEILDSMEELENNEEKPYNMKWANLQGRIEGIMIRENYGGEKNDR